MSKHLITAITGIHIIVTLVALQYSGDSLLKLISYMRGSSYKDCNNGRNSSLLRTNIGLESNEQDYIKIRDDDRDFIILIARTMSLSAKLPWNAIQGEQLGDKTN